MTARGNQQHDVTAQSSIARQSKLQAEVMRQSARWSELADVEVTVQKAVASVANEPSLQQMLSGHASSGCAVGFVLSDNDAIRQLNKTYRNMDKPTNVLSFPSAPGPAHPDDDDVTYLGDIVIAYETVVAEAEDQGRTARDHLSHLVIHGLLHVLGYNHETDDDARDMEQLEVSLLAKIGIKNPYDETFQDEISQ